MTKRENYEFRAESLLLPVLEKLHFELVDLEYVKEAGNYYLRAYIDKNGGITIDDCETVSRAFGDLLDREDFIDDAYILEVSSPGLGRPVRKEKDFVRNLGKEIEVRLYKPKDGAKDFRGKLCSYDADSISVRMEDSSVIIFLRKEIALIREAFDL